ncbi:MAG: electron transfer flavoprotein subunit beta/FixA family protein [Candidatus Bathyarchaeia archaeon]
MNIVVCVKHATDENELQSDELGKPRLNPAARKMATFDHNAVEAAVRIRDSKGGSITVVSLGDDDCKKTVKEALAMGGDRGLVILSNSNLDALMTSYYLAKAIQKIGNPDLILCSEGASDTYVGFLGPMLAEWMNLPFIGYARDIEITEPTVKCEEQLEDRIETIAANLPAVVSVVSEINEPRYTTLLQIIQASKKPIEEITLESLKAPDFPYSQVEVIDVSAETSNRKRIIFEGSPETTAKMLITALDSEGITT